MYNEVKRKPTIEKNAGLYIKLGSINATVEAASPHVGKSID